MSYILDALVKADYERQRESGRSVVPGLHTVHARLLPATDAQGTGRLRMAVGIGASGLLLAAGWQFWAMRPVPKERPAGIPAEASLPAAPTRAASPPLTAAAPAGAMTPATPTETARPRPATPAVRPPPPAAAATPATPAAPVPAATVAAAPAERAARPAPSARGDHAARPVAAAPTPAPTVASTTPGETRPPARVLRLGELPPALQKEIPKIAVSGFANADVSENRMAIINDRALREGDLLAGGVRLDTIAADGVVFSYKGYRFRVGAP